MPDFSRLKTLWRSSVLLKSASGSMALRITGAAFGFLNSILLARLLGPAEFGVYSIVMAAVGLLSTLAALGLPSLVIREVAVYQSKAQWSLLKGVLLISHRWTFVTSLILVLGSTVFIAGYLHGNSLTIMGWLTALLLIPFTALSQLRAALLRGLHWVVVADIPDLVMRPILVTLGIVIIYILAYSLDSNVALSMQAAAVAAAFIVGSWLLKSRIPWQHLSVPASYRRKDWLAGSGLFLIATLFGMLESQLPLYMLGALKGPEQAALFQVAGQIVSLVVLGLSAVNLPLQPKLAAAWGKGDIRQAQVLVSEAAKMASLLAISSAVVLIPFAETILNIYGHNYTGSAWVLRILVVGQIINALSGSCGIVLAMTGHQKLLLLGLVCALIVNVLVSMLTIPKLDAFGAALATTVSLLVWNMLLMSFAWKRTGLKTFVRLREQVGMP